MRVVRGSPRQGAHYDYPCPHASNVRWEGGNMAKAKKSASVVSVTIAKRGGPKPAIELKTGLTQGKKYLVTINQPRGRPVLIGVHL